MRKKASKTKKKTSVVKAENKLAIPAEVVKQIAPEVSDSHARKLGKIVGKTVTIQQTRSAPLPDPRELQHYEKILKGAANRIFAMAENQATHRQQIEKTIVQGQTKNARMGIMFSFTIVMTAVISGSILIGLGKNVEGLTSIIIAITSAAGLFIFSRIKKVKDLSKKQKKTGKP